MVCLSIVEDYPEPEHIHIYCNNGHDISKSECDICHLAFIDMYDLYVSCKDKDHHVCMDCYDTDMDGELL